MSTATMSCVNSRKLVLAMPFMLAGIFVLQSSAAVAGENVTTDTESETSLSFGVKCGTRETGREETAQCNDAQRIALERCECAEGQLKIVELPPPTPECRETSISGTSVAVVNCVQSFTCTCTAP